jgi:hypothetical protein
LINNFKEDSNKQINEVRKLIQQLDKKINNMEDKFKKEMKIMKNNKVKTLEMKIP